MARGPNRIQLKNKLFRRAPVSGNGTQQAAAGFAA
jgi:hypothetical protein